MNTFCPFEKMRITIREHVEQLVHLFKVDLCKPRIVAGNVLAVVDQIGQLDRLGAPRGLRQVAAIDRLATRPVAIPGLADVGQFFNQFGDGDTERCLDVLQRGLRVLDRVMQPGSCNRVWVVSNRGNGLGHGTQVHMVRLVIVLSAVIDPLVRLGRINTRTVHQVCSCRRISHNVEPRSL